MAIKNYNWILFCFFLLATGCKSIQHISKTDVQYTVVRADAAPKEDQAVTVMIAPYKKQLDAVMNEVLGTLPFELSKQKPESTLGNWAADVILERTRKDGHQVDFAFVNYGGLRVPYLTAGPLTRGELYELSPFDNTIMVLDVPGTKLDSVFLLIGESEGWPVSKGIKLEIKDKKVMRLEINDQKLDPNKIYKVATLDYVATGGDNMSMLIPLSRVQTGIIFRDALIDHVKDASGAGRTISPAIEGRIVKLN